MTAHAFTWRPMADARAQAELARVLDSWRGTPYMSGQRAKGAGVDCVQFVVAVLDELAGRVTDARSIAGAITPDAAAHAPELARAALARLVARFDADQVTDHVLEPGDIVATGPAGGGPGHAVIVGTDRRICWDATYPAVRQISLGLAALMGHEVFGAWRLRDRTWPRA